MSNKNKSKSTEKTSLHPRNPHRFQYDFPKLIRSTPELARFVGTNKYENESIDFANAAAVKVLNRAILRHFYKIDYWDIPANYLCPPIPGRADYIHYLADLISDKGKIPAGKNITGLDIGMGANCVYPILGHQSYGWNFIGSDVDVKALESAQKIVDLNALLTPFIECRLQQSSSHIFMGIIQPDEKFDFTMSNPPFHGSPAEALQGTQRKWKNLGLGKAHQVKALNFGGQNAELWCPGGEKGFLNKMIDESLQVAKQCFWFTSLVSKKTTLPTLYQSLTRVGAVTVKTIEMSQGQKVSRILAWTFLNEKEQELWKAERWKR